MRSVHGWSGRDHPWSCGGAHSPSANPMTGQSLTRQSTEGEFNDWVNRLPVEAKNKLEGQLKPALDCARKIIIRRGLPRSKFATVICLALPPRAITELEALVPEFVNCDLSY